MEEWGKGGVRIEYIHISKWRIKRELGEDI